jgi:2-phospho-L-lactate transferase/gluconeogenesis factor (CofD/UPF0052 family)
MSVRILICTGGTGSIALQRGLYATLESLLDGIDTKVLVNAYDNGLSTGAVRQVMQGQILGPSDVRKNQATRLSLKNPSSPWLTFLNKRFTTGISEAKKLCRGAVQQLTDCLDGTGCDDDCHSILCAAIDEYFAAPLAEKIEYKDFSLANVIYAGMARSSGNSLRAAAATMSRMMGIPDCVILNDDRSLYLGAITKSGRRIADEGEIVSWGQVADPFVDVYFTDSKGRQDEPKLCLEAWQAIASADLVILSSGTQWSSLIPTYVSDGFREAVALSKAEIVMIMNRIPDKDSPGQTASEIVESLIPRFFEPNRIHLITDVNGHRRMSGVSDGALAKLRSFDKLELSTPRDQPDKHNPDKLADAIGRIYFGEYLDSDFYLFDYDDTLVGRGGTLPRSSQFNITGISRLNGLIDVGICTGNTIRAVRLDPVFTPGAAVDIGQGKPVMVFADGGANLYSYKVEPCDDGCERSVRLIGCNHPDLLLPIKGKYCIDNIVAELERVGIPKSKIECRGNAIIAIRPIKLDEREILLNLIKHILRDSELGVYEVGRTTVEICRPSLSKVWALIDLQGLLASSHTITYVGDELRYGNDTGVGEFARRQNGVRCLEVANPAKTAFFISTLIGCVTKNAQH